MTARDDAIKAGVQAYADMRQERLVLSDVEFVAAVVDAVEPIIRADERERMKANLSGVYAGIRASAEAEVRERIAQEIEDERDHFCRHRRTDWEHPLARAFARSARIARGQP